MKVSKDVCANTHPMAHDAPLVLLRALLPSASALLASMRDLQSEILVQHSVQHAAQQENIEQKFGKCLQAGSFEATYDEDCVPVGLAQPGVSVVATGLPTVDRIFLSRTCLGGGFGCWLAG